MIRLTTYWDYGKRPPQTTDAYLMGYIECQNPNPGLVNIWEYMMGVLDGLGDAENEST